MKRSVISTLIPLLAIAIYLGGRYFYFKPKLIQGEKAPAFSAKLADGSPFSLSSLEGHYVLLDFWGSWCGPCRAQNRQWVDLHRQYEGRKIAGAAGFTIVSIGVETNRPSWENAIRVDSLYWRYHILDQASSLKFFNSPLATQYGVKQLPTSFLLNPKGVIIASNPSPEEVAAILEKTPSKKG